MTAWAIRTKANGSTAMSQDPFAPLDDKKERHPGSQATKALAAGAGASIQSTEQTYALMIAISNSLGVNCTFCHNSRAFMGNGRKARRSV